MVSLHPYINDISPVRGVAGGNVVIGCRGFRPGLPSDSRVVFGQAAGDIVSASEERIVASIPEGASPGVTLISDGRTSPVFPFEPAARIATGLHPVCSPVVAADGSIITTFSGSRGQEVAQPLIRLTPSGEKFPFSCDVVNPTGLTFGPDGQLYLSSRNDGVVYRYTDFERLELVADDLGIACGIVFDSRGALLVGDRTGRVCRIDSTGRREDFAKLEPSVSAYHLAIDSEDNLYVTGPTLAVRDPLLRISRDGAIEVVFRGLARPQGMAFLPDGNLLLAAAYDGKKGVFRFSPRTGSLEHFASGPTLVGLAVSGDDLYLVDNQSLLRLPIEGSGSPRQAAQPPISPQ